MSTALNLTQNFVMIECGQCGILFWVTVHYQDELRETKRSFYCPNGHNRHYATSTAEKLQKELDAERQRREMAEREAAMEKKLRVKADKASAKLKKRIQNGVCPCCQRSFQNLRRHIETKHPDFEKKA